MQKLTDTMRPKVNGDTMFIPDRREGVYFRNNSSSFRMGGESVDRWIEKLIPMFNGNHTLGDLTKGLPGSYRDRIYEITEVLYRNGFIRDVSQDRPHQLSKAVRDNYRSQIEFLDNLGGSGAYRFEKYRQEKVLAIGSGPFFVSLVSALFESGMANFKVHITNPVSTDQNRIEELAAYALKKDREIKIEEAAPEKEGIQFWRKMIREFDAVLFVNDEGDVEQLRMLNAICKKEKKRFIPALFHDIVGLAGPLVDEETNACWESAWRSIHRSVFDKDRDAHSYSSTAASMLANVIVFEWFKRVTGVTEKDPMNRVFVLNLETLEGEWHPFQPHPLVTKNVSVERENDPVSRLKNEMVRRDKEGLFRYFGRITSEVAGIFHIWDEEDGEQLPLSQCNVQVVDPKSEGPAELLPRRICSGMTHEEARREAGLTGIEMYVTRLSNRFLPEKSLHFYRIGAGETFSESVHRGLIKCLIEEQRKQVDQKMRVCPVEIHTIEDAYCTFYLEALTTMQGKPVIGLGEKVAGLPIVWVRSGERWYGGVDLTITLALRNALQGALMNAQNGQDACNSLSFNHILVEETEVQRVNIEPCDDQARKELLVSVVERFGERLEIHEWTAEPVLQKGTMNVLSVWLREEESR